MVELIARPLDPITAIARDAGVSRQTVYNRMSAPVKRWRTVARAAHKAGRTPKCGACGAPARSRSRGCTPMAACCRAHERMLQLAADPHCRRRYLPGSKAAAARAMIEAWQGPHVAMRRQCA